MNMYEKIYQLCEERGIKPGKLCVEIGIPKSTLTELKQGRTKSLSTQTLSKIAQYFNVSLGYFDETFDPVDGTRFKRESCSSICHREQQKNSLIPL